MPFIHSPRKKDQAVLLRKSGNSLRIIAKELGVSVSTAQLWTKEVILSDDQKQKIAFEHRKRLIKGQTIFNQQRRLNNSKKELDIFTEAKNEIHIRKKDAFFVMGLALYWAEGFKKDHSLGFVNSDPVMIKMFVKWLKVYGEIDATKIHPRIQIHEIYKSDIKRVEAFWANFLDLPLSQFKTPFFQISKSKSTLVDNTYVGLLRIRVTGGRELFVKILGWLEGLKTLDY